MQETMQTAYCLSVRQPWAYLICAGVKDIENRTWQCRHRGRILIHAGKAVSKEGLAWCDELRIELPGQLPQGGIVGWAEITDCVTAHRSEWFEGPWGWVLRCAGQLPFRPLTGKLGLFRVDATAEELRALGIR